MGDDPRSLEEVAGAILEGTPVDWPGVEAAATPADRHVLEELRLVSTLADAHRQIATSDEDPPAEGEVSHRYWGRLRLIELVASGSFGDVFRAWDPRLRREVALKLIELTGNDARHSAAVLHEGRLLARVRHPNVVTIYDAERIGSEVGLSMEFVRGQTIERRIAGKGVFTSADTVGIGAQLCAALAAAHDVGVLHRDVKAANVVITPEDRVVLMDFGAARQRDEGIARAAGTPLYVAPEVLDGGESTAASDVYSLGVLLHHMLTAEYPVAATSLQELRQAHTRRRADWDRMGAAAAPGIPRRLAEVLHRATHPDPASRYASAAALGDALRSLQRSHLSWVGGLLIVGVIGLAGVAGATWVDPRPVAPPEAGAAAVRSYNPEAFRLFVEGRTAIDRFSTRGTRLAHGLFLQALTHDPDFAEAHAALAEVYLLMNPAIPHVTAAEAVRRGTEAARRALDLDATLPAAWAASAAVRSIRRDWAGAEADYRQAIDLGPGDVTVRRQFARWLSLLDRADEAVAEARIAERLDPESPRTLLGVASALRFARRFEESIVYANRILAIDPDYTAAHHVLGHNYQGLGRLVDAIASFERMGRPSGNLGHAYALAGRTKEAREVAAHFEQEFAAQGIGAGELAQIYAGLGEIDRAFGWLDRLEQTQAAMSSTFRVAIVWDPLRGDPRFDALLKRYSLD